MEKNTFIGEDINLSTSKPFKQCCRHNIGEEVLGSVVVESDKNGYNGILGSNNFSGRILSVLVIVFRI